LKLLIDFNLSPKLIPALADLFPARLMSRQRYSNCGIRFGITGGVSAAIQVTEPCDKGKSGTTTILDCRDLARRG